MLTRATHSTKYRFTEFQLNAKSCAMLEVSKDRQTAAVHSVKCSKIETQLALNCQQFFEFAKVKLPQVFSLSFRTQIYWYLKIILTCAIY